MNVRLRNEFIMLRQSLLLVVLAAPAMSQCPSSRDPTIGAPGANNDVLAFGTFDEGAGPRLFADGDFTQIGGVSAAHIARWDGTNWTAVGTGFDGPVYAIAVYDDGSGSGAWLYASGFFTSSPASHLLQRWNGNMWMDAPPGGPFDAARFERGWCLAPAARTRAAGAWHRPPSPDPTFRSDDVGIESSSGTD
jgi:hypothetical protein